jgi:hypothetical protein
MNISIEYESFPVRKALIKASPQMSLSDIVAKACLQLKLDNHEKYTLQMNKKELDLQLSVRFANLAQSSKLKLILKNIVKNNDANVQITLQIDNQNYTESFSPDTLLWDILVTAEAKHALSLTKRTGVIPVQQSLIPRITTFQKPVYMMPVLLCMNKEYATIPELQSKTVGDIGLGSRGGAIRLLFKYVDGIENYTHYFNTSKNVTDNTNITSSALQDLKSQPETQRMDIKMDVVSSVLQDLKSQPETQRKDMKMDVVSSVLQDLKSQPETQRIEMKTSNEIKMDVVNLDILSENTVERISQIKVPYKSSDPSQSTIKDANMDLTDVFVFFNFNFLGS